MAEIKRYEVEAIRCEFIPDGDPFRGSLRILYPELAPYVGRLNLTDAKSRRQYARDAAEQLGVSEELLRDALEEVSAKRHEEVTAVIEAGEGSGGGGAETSASDADILVGYAEDFELFHTPDEKSHATFRVGDHEETWPVKSKRFEQWLRQLFYKDVGKVPGATALQSAIDNIAAKAAFDGHEERVFLRIARREDAVYVDLCNNSWEAAKVTATEWRVVADPPVKFVRNKNSAPLPYPARDGDINGLRPFLNLHDENGFRLSVGWLVGAFKPAGPYPLLEITGEQGTAKSTAVRMLRSLVDPAFSPLRSLPGNERDLAIAANGNWILSFDNLSYVPTRVSDAMCRLSTGGGFGTRTLYTDEEETILDALRPQMVNGINQVVLRGDLQERSLLVTLLPIPNDERREERKIWADFEEARPAILGALLDAVSCALCNFENVRLEALPRMADFAVWVTAAEEALGWEPGAFMAAYIDNRKAMNEATLGEDPLASAVRKLLNDQAAGEWRGPSEELLEELGEKVSDEVKRSKAWPKAPNHLSRRMKRLAPLLREVGIEYFDGGREGANSRKVKMLRLIDPPSQPAGDDNLDTAEQIADEDLDFDADEDDPEEQ